MKKQHLKALISYRLERSEQAIQAAKIMLENDMPAFAMNRIYYAMFYAVQAMLAFKNVAFSKHGQVKGYFNRHMIKTGILPIDMGRTYNKVFEYRQKFDYVDFAVPDRKMISEYIVKAMEFRKAISEYLDKQEGGVPDRIVE